MKKLSAFCLNPFPLRRASRICESGDYTGSDGADANSVPDYKSSKEMQSNYFYGLNADTK